MFPTHGIPTPPSPLLLAGSIVASMPPSLLRPGLNLALTMARRRHPDLFDRLSSLDDPTYLIDPVDLPLVFILSLDPDKPRLSALNHADADATTSAATAATIRGPLSRLIDLLQGRVDGDALFFSRELVIEGDTEAIVALRNAIESVEIDLLDDALSALGPLAYPARRAIGLGNALFDRAGRDLAAILGPGQTPDSPPRQTTGRNK